MSVPQEFILSDNRVSRMLAVKAIHDKDFEKLLTKFVESHGEAAPRAKNFKMVKNTIADMRDEIAEEAALQAPPATIALGTQGAPPQNLNTYLMQKTHFKVLYSYAPTVLNIGAAAEVYEWGWVGTSLSVARLALDFLDSILRFQADPTPFPFERLPPEVRQQVYREVLRGALPSNLTGAKPSGLTGAELITVNCNKDDVLLFRFGLLDMPTFPSKAECRYDGTAGIVCRGESTQIGVNLLAANKLINTEALPILYQTRTFDFETNVDIVIPFLSSLPQEARHYLKGISMELHSKDEVDYCHGGKCKQYGKGRDNKRAWVEACAYIGEHVNVKELNVIVNVKVPEEFKTLKWVKALVKIRGLERLTLKVDQHYDNRLNSAALLVKGTYQDGEKSGVVTATDKCDSEHLVAFFEYLLVEMVRSNRGEP